MNNFTPNAKYINHEVDIKKFKKVLTDLSIVLSYDLEACKDIINIKYGHLKGISYPIFKECLFAFLNKKLDILTSMFFAEQHSVPIDQLKRVAESDIPGDQPIPLNAQEEEMKRIKETLSLTDDVNLIILHRSIYVLKKKFEEFNKEIKEIYKEYNENDNEEEGVVVDAEKVEEIVKRIGRKCLFEVDKKEFKDAVVDELCYAGGDMFRNGEVMERLKEFVGKERRKYNKIFKVKKERKEVDLKEFEGYNGENEEEDDMCKVVIEPIEEEVNEEEREEVNEDNEGNEDVKEGEGEENEDKDEGKENVDEINEDGKDDVDKSKSNENNESNESNNDEERKEGDDDEKKSEKLENIEKNDGENEGNKDEEKKEDVKNENDDEQKEKDKNDNEEEEEEEEDDEHEEKEKENEENEKDENEIKNEEIEKSVINKENSIDMKQSNDLKSNIDDKLSNIPNNDNISKSKSNLNNSHLTNNNISNNNNDNLSNSNQDALQPSTPPPEQSETKSLHSTKPPLQKEYKKYYLYIETLPLILADFLTSTPLSIILERNPSNLTNLRVLFDNEIMSRLGEETTYQIHLLKSERLKECLFSLSKIETNITHYNSILTQKQLQNENTTYITAMLNKLTSTKNFLTNTINTIQNDTNTYNEYQDKQGNYLQDQTTTELNQTKPSNAMMLINNTNNEIQQQLPSINDISNIDNNNQHQSNILNETVSIISNNNNNNNVNNVQPPSSSVMRFQTSVSSALSTARVNNNSKNYINSRILLRQQLTKEQKRVNAIKEIFAFYARQHVNNNQIGTFDSLKLKLEHMNLSEFSKFCSEFQLLIPKDKRIEIFKKNISNTNTITINEFNNILPQLAKAIRDDKVNRLKKQILQNKLLLRHYKEQDDKKIIENISESIIVYKYANIDEQINKDKDEIKSLLKKDENILLEELYTYLEIDDEKKYRSKMKGFIAHSGKLILPKIQSENRIKNITERTKYEVKSMLTQHKLQMERDAEEKRKVEGMHKEYQKKQLEVFNRLYDKALKQRDKLERERKKVNEVKFIQPTNRVDNPFRRYYKAESVIHGMWKHAEHNKGFDDAYYNVVPQFKEEVKKNKKEDKGKERKVVRFVGEKVMEGGVKEKEMGKDVSIRDDEGNKDDMWGNNNNRKKSAFTWESLEKMSINEFKEREDIARLLGVNDL